MVLTKTGKILLAVMLAILLVGAWAGFIVGRATYHCDTCADEQPAQLVAEAPEEMPHYPLTDADRDIVERVVMVEAGAEPYEGQIAVAQCILNSSLATDSTPGEEALRPGQFAQPYEGEVTDSVKEAVAAVFDRGEVVTVEPIRYFYAPALCTSEWHESLCFVVEIGGHRFFRDTEAV